MSSNTSRRQALALCTLALVACPTDDGDTTTETGQTETGGTEGGLDDGICELEDPFACECFIWNTEWVPEGIVYGTYDAAVSACVNLCLESHPQFDDTRITPIECSEVPPLTDCSDWPPPRAIKLEKESGLYLVARTLVERFMLDPDPLRTCDDAVLTPLMSGGCVLVGANPGELVHELGLRDDDVLLSLNHYPLNSTLDLVVAFSKLWSNDATVLELELRRDGRTLSLRYRLVEQ